MRAGRLVRPPRRPVSALATLAARGQAGEKVLLRALNSSQAVRYLELAEQREANETFLFGWLAGRVA